MNRQNKPDRFKSEQQIQNWGFDEEFLIPTVATVEFDGGNAMTRKIGNSIAIRLAEVGNVTYVGKAPAGSDESEAVWQIFKIDETSGLSKTWADADTNFDNVWADYATLTYL